MKTEAMIVKGRKEGGYEKDRWEGREGGKDVIAQ